MKRANKHTWWVQQCVASFPGHPTFSMLHAEVGWPGNEAIQCALCTVQSVYHIRCDKEGSVRSSTVETVLILLELM